VSDAEQVSFDTRVRLAIQETFIAGRPTPTVERIATDLGANVADVGAAFDRLAEGHVIVLVPGTRTIRMSAPFAGAPTDFVVAIGANTHHANCIWDALGIAAMLAGAGRGADAEVRTHCADCGEALSVVVTKDAVASRPQGAVVHFAVPAARWWADIGFT
jgi:hypothetical protein